MENYTGKRLKVKLPSGHTVTIREQNGNDDDIISTVSDALNGVMLSKFLAEIIIDQDVKQGMLTYEDIKKWKVNDVYYLILKSRIHSLGNILEFKVVCQNSNCRKENAFEEDLSIFDTNLENYKPLSVEDPKYNPYRIKPYIKGKNMGETITLPSGKIVRFEYLTVEGEYFYGLYTQENLSKNKELIVRNLSLNIGSEEWQPIANFAIFSPIDMRAIRNSLAELETIFEPMMECTCPHCKNSTAVSLMKQPDFFFPL